MDSLSDSAATGAVLFSMAVGYFTELKIDGWCGCLVACFVLYAGYEAAKDTLNPLWASRRRRNTWSGSGRS